MNDLFGFSTPPAKLKKAKKPITNQQTQTSLGGKELSQQTGLRRPTPGGPIEQAWKTYNWEPREGLLCHFNAGVGYDLQTNKKYPFQGCFGYIQEVNTEAGEVLVHLPKPIRFKGDDNYYIVPFFDLLPPQVVDGFDSDTFIKTRPMIPFQGVVRWNVSSR